MNKLTLFISLLIVLVNKYEGRKIAQYRIGLYGIENHEKIQVGQMYNIPDRKPEDQNICTAGDCKKYIKDYIYKKTKFEEEEIEENNIVNFQDIFDVDDSYSFDVITGAVKPNSCLQSLASYIELRKKPYIYSYSKTEIGQEISIKKIPREEINVDLIDGIKDSNLAVITQVTYGNKLVIITEFKEKTIARLTYDDEDELKREINDAVYKIMIEDGTAELLEKYSGLQFSVKASVDNEDCLVSDNYEELVNNVDKLKEIGTKFTQTKSHPVSITVEEINSIKIKLNLEKVPVNNRDFFSTDESDGASERLTSLLTDFESINKITNDIIGKSVGLIDFNDMLRNINHLYNKMDRLYFYKTNYDDYRGEYSNKVLNYRENFYTMKTDTDNFDNYYEEADNYAANMTANINNIN